MLAGVRAAALTQLKARDEVEQTRDRFAGHVVREVTDLIAASRATWGSDVIGTLLGEFDNIAAALRHCIAADDTPDRAFLLCAVLWGVVHQAHLDDVHELGRLTFERWPDPTPPFGPDAAATLATALLRLGRVDDAVEHAKQALPAADAALLAPVTLRRTLGLAARATGDHELALTWFGEAGGEARARQVHTLALECDVFRAQALADLGRPEESLRIVRTAAAAARAIDSVINELWARTIEGVVLVALDPVAAVPVVEETLAASSAIDYPFGVTTNLVTLVTCRVRAADLSGASAAAIELMDGIGRSGSGDLRLALEAAAGVLHAADRDGWRDLVATARTLPGPIATANPIAQLKLPDAPDGRLLARPDALRLARRLLVELPSALDAAAGAPGPVEVADAGAAPDEAVFTQAGDLWDVRFAGVNVHLKPSKGMADLAVLLAQPNREVHCLDLTGAAVDERSAGEAIDAAARRRYEERVRELQAEIDEAEDHHDTGRAERAREELDAIVDHLTSALGLGGTARPQAATAERARTAVAHRLRSTIRRIANVHPQLGRHLEVSVTSGTYCCYRPERDVAWRTTSS
jgi:tetratricopeptide (TPR) repeat protein